MCKFTSFLTALDRLTRKINALGDRIPSHKSWVYASKNDLIRMESRIMSKISDNQAATDAALLAIATTVDSLVVSVQGVASDVTGLKDIILQLQNSPGQITPEDQALLDQGQAKVEALRDRLIGVAATAKSLDDATPEVPPVTTKAKSK